MANETEGSAAEESGLKSGGNIEAKAPSRKVAEESDTGETRSGGNIEAKGPSRVGDEDAQGEGAPTA